MMNVIQLQDDLKNFSEDQLVAAAQSQAGNIPQFLVLGEMMRRKRMSQDYERRKSQRTGTVLEDTLAAAGVGGLGQMPAALAPNTDVTANAGANPAGRVVGPVRPDPVPEGYADGGFVGPFADYYRRSFHERYPYMQPWASRRGLDTTREDMFRQAKESRDRSYARYGVQAAPMLPPEADGYMFRRVPGAEMPVAAGRASPAGLGGAVSYGAFAPDVMDAGPTTPRFNAGWPLEGLHGAPTGLATNFGRPVYQYPDTGASSELTTTIKLGAKWYNVPTIGPNGVLMDPADVEDAYRNSYSRAAGQDPLKRVFDPLTGVPITGYATKRAAEEAAASRSDSITVGPEVSYPTMYTDKPATEGPVAINVWPPQSFDRYTPGYVPPDVSPFKPGTAGPQGTIPGSGVAYPETEVFDATVPYYNNLPTGGLPDVNVMPPPYIVEPGLDIDPRVTAMMGDMGRGEVLKAEDNLGRAIREADINLPPFVDYLVDWGRGRGRTEDRWPKPPGKRDSVDSPVSGGQGWNTPALGAPDAVLPEQGESVGTARPDAPGGGAIAAAPSSSGGGGLGGSFGSYGDYITKQMELADQRQRQDKWLALAMAGAALASSEAPSFGSALGEAMQTGLGVLANSRDAYQARTDELMQMKIGLAAARAKAGASGAPKPLDMMSQNQILDQASKAWTEYLQATEILKNGEWPGDEMAGESGQPLTDNDRAVLEERAFRAFNLYNSLNDMSQIGQSAYVAG